MRHTRIFFNLGLLLIFFSAVTVAVVFVLPYSRLIGKPKLDPRDFIDEPNADVSRPTVGPIFSGLKEKPSVSDKSFYLTIQKLGIVRAQVTAEVPVDNQRPEYLNALSQSLAHLKGTPLPGQRGDSVIFGHSSLPFLFNPNNFQTIFTRLDELRRGDLLQIDSGSLRLVFRVENYGIIDNSAIISDFRSVKPRLTLLTCYPPGFKSQKYLVNTVLAD
ncbi:MAG: sortase [Patescibacteria group bacterium]|nr:sortase [Patescibacteria group bacterium]